MKTRRLDATRSLVGGRAAPMFPRPARCVFSMSHPRDYRSRAGSCRPIRAMVTSAGGDKGLWRNGRRSSPYSDTSSFVRVGGSDGSSYTAYDPPVLLYPNELETLPTEPKTPSFRQEMRGVPRVSDEASSKPHPRTLSNDHRAPYWTCPIERERTHMRRHYTPGGDVRGEARRAGRVTAFFHGDAQDQVRIRIVVLLVKTERDGDDGETGAGRERQGDRGGLARGLVAMSPCRTSPRARYDRATATGSFTPPLETCEPERPDSPRHSRPSECIPLSFPSRVLWDP